MAQQLKLAFLDAATMGDDLDLSPFAQFGELTVYDNTLSNQVVERIKDIDILLVNKVKLTREQIDQATRLRLICIAATGMDILDVAYARGKGLGVMNVAGYSTDSVAQTTFLHILNCVEHGTYFNTFIHDGRYPVSGLPTHYGAHYFHELSALRIGIIGMGAIGRKVAAIASAFGMDVVYYSSTGQDRCEGRYPRLELDALLATCDIISIHSPLNDRTRHLLGRAEFQKMKRSAYVFNMGRGAIWDEAALVDALNEGEIAGAGTDVFEKEPIAPDHFYYQVKDKEKLFLTPHIGWASIEARVRLIGMMVDNIKRFLAAG